MKCSVEVFEEVRTSLDQQTKSRMMIEENFIYRHHVEPRVKLYSPKEETFPIPLKYVDVTRSTHTNVDVLQESRIHDCWHIDANRNLSESWTSFTQFTMLNERPPAGQMWSGGSGSQKFKQLPDLIICGQIFGPECQKQLNERKSSSGQSKNRRLTLRES